MLNRTAEQWAKVRPDAVVEGSAVQARNVLEMALQDIAAQAQRIRDLEDERDSWREWASGRRELPIGITEAELNAGVGL